MELDGRRWTLIVAELFMFSLLVFPVAPQSPSGFVSIDCGGAGGRDEVTGLDWESDGKYLLGADQLALEGVTVNASVTLGASPTPVDNEERLKTALVFYPGNPAIARSKYCYHISIGEAGGIAVDLGRFLLRATFPSRNLLATGQDISLGVYTTRFYFSVDSTYISTVELDESEPQTIELIFAPLDTEVYVCLVPLEDRSSMPAISALELRPVSNLYSRDNVVDVGTAYLMTISRLNFGGDPEMPSLRYPTDKFDRLWSAPSIQSTDVKAIVNTSVIDLSRPPIDFFVQAPETVLSTAWEGTSSASSISFLWNLTNPRPGQPLNVFSYGLLFYDIVDRSNGNVTRIVDVDIQRHYGQLEFPGGFVAVYPLSTYEIDEALTINGGSGYQRQPTFTTGDIINITIRTNGNSQRPAMINAAEIYGELNAVTGRTVTDDGAAVGDFAVEFPDRLDGTADPCLPAPWAWIVCSIEVPPRVTQINVTTRGVGGNIPHAFGRLNRLTVLDLSNNKFNGSVPSDLGNISSLRALNLGRNELSGDLPTFTSRSLQNLELLSLSNNRLRGDLSSLISALDDTLSVLDVSNNSFNGNIPADIERLAGLKTLDVSNNHLSGELEVDLVKITNLQTLDLSNNNIAGTVPGNLWSHSTLAVANLDRNNFTELNLTTWYLSVTKAKSFDDGRRVRLVGNQIQHIILPALPPLETTIPTPSSDQEQRQTLQSPTAFILLGDNPWCKDRGASLLDRYLCRSDESQNFWPPPRRGKGLNTTTVIIVAVVCGLLVVVMACVLAYFIWRMRERTRELHQIQEALAKLHVQPPFFSYEDLKAATHSFSSDRVLGKGGFGIVYRADLADGSVLAVKKLNPTEQNTTEFLKEIVNITGIKHKHLIQLRGCCVREKWQRMLVYEYAENKSLAEALWGPDKPYVLSWKQRFNICLGIARGLAYLHEELQPMMVHRDIKPQNILLDKDYNAKIADFGLVRPAQMDKDTQVTANIGGTLGYCSPEYLNEGAVSEKLDVYSYGVVLLEIVSGRRCINRQLPEDQIYLPTWATALYEEDKLLSLVDEQLAGEYDEEEVLLTAQTALACCQLDAKKRPTMSQVMNKLVHQADIAIDILRELSTRRAPLDSILENDMGDDEYDTNYTDETEERSLTGNSENSTAILQLSDMRSSRLRR